VSFRVTWLLELRAQQEDVLRSSQQLSVTHSRNPTVSRHRSHTWGADCNSTIENCHTLTHETNGAAARSLLCSLFAARSASSNSGFTDSPSGRITSEVASGTLEYGIKIGRQRTLHRIETSVARLQGRFSRKTETHLAFQYRGNSRTPKTSPNASHLSMGSREAPIAAGDTRSTLEGYSAHEAAVAGGQKCKLHADCRSTDLQTGSKRPEHPSIVTAFWSS
jgi:hypothetical protein